MKFKTMYAAVALVCISTPALADTPLPIDRFLGATAAIEARFGPADEHRTPPSDTDPDVVKNFTDLHEAMAVFGTDAFPANLQTISSICGQLGNLATRYVSVGTANIPAGSAKLIAMENSNTIKYQDDQLALLVEADRCMAVHIPLFIAFWDSLPVDQRTSARLAGLQRMQGGVYNMADGLARITSEKGYSRTNQTRSAKALAETADAYAQILTLRQRRDLLDEIRLAAPSLAKSYPEAFKAVNGALTRTDCNSICAAAPVH